jgi:hypothetical protein
VSLHAYVLLKSGEEIEVGTPFLTVGKVGVAVEIGSPSGGAYTSIQGTPEDMDRLAEVAHAAAERARAAEPELRAKAGEGASS